VERRARHLDRLGDLYLIDPVATMWWSDDEKAIAAARKRATTAIEVFLGETGKGRFLLGDELTLADLGPAIATDYLVRLSVSVPTPLREWCDRCFEVPAMRQARDEAMPFIERLHPAARKAN
jgi:glutathione S-transferase